MELDKKIWNNEFRLRKNLFSYAKMITTLATINIIVSITTKNWIMIIINAMHIIPALLTILSKFQFDKLPPKR